MHRADGLFKLIKNMTKSEKGYFKKFVQGFGNTDSSDYLVLFNLIDKAEKPDNESIEKHFSRRKKEVNTRALRRYLYQLIIKSLRLFYEKNNYRFEATNRVNEVEVLMNKGFDNEAYNLVEESVKHCQKYELNELKLLFLSYEHMTFGDLNWEEVPAIRERVRIDILNTLKQVEYITEIKHLELKIIHMSNLFFPTNDEGKLLELEKLMQHPVMQDVTKLTALEAILGYDNVWRVYYTLKGDVQRAYKHASTCSPLIEERNAINKNFIGRYARGILNHAKLAADLEKQEEAKDLLEKLKHIPVEGVGDAEWLEVTFAAGLIHFLKRFPTTDKKKMAVQAEEQLLNSDLMFETMKRASIYDLAVYYFYIRDFDHALDLLAHIINRRPEGSRVLYVHARLLQIVIHYELNNRLLLPSLMKSTFRFMAKAEIKFDFERIILRFFTRVLRPSNHVVLKDELAWMKAEMEKSSLSEYEKTPLKVFNYIKWLESKTKS